MKKFLPKLLIVILLLGGLYFGFREFVQEFIEDKLMTPPVTTAVPTTTNTDPTTEPTDETSETSDTDSTEVETIDYPDPAPNSTQDKDGNTLSEPSNALGNGGTTLDLTEEQLQNLPNDNNQQK